MSSPIVSFALSPSPAPPPRAPELDAGGVGRIPAVRLGREKVRAQARDERTQAALYSRGKKSARKKILKISVNIEMRKKLESANFFENSYFYRILRKLGLSTFSINSTFPATRHNSFPK